METKQLDEIVLVWCEWDIGQDYKSFTNEIDALDWAKEALEDCGIDDEFSDLLDENLIGTKSIQISYNK